ncbi:MAG: NADH-quinone oxidoreductase subunit NuoG [Proteobacteria bacterium]|nr:NADH-quinone oxidoreductase subunit NuoG [Pseudomonadota bacterium]
MLKVTIDNKEVGVKEDATILEAAQEAGIKIPTLCYHKRLLPFGACRVCLVEVEGMPGRLIPSCTTPVTNGMVVRTSTTTVIKARKTVLELLLVNHPLDCPVCDKGGECSLQDLVYEYEVTSNRFQDKKFDFPVDFYSPLIERNLNRCILCGKCARVCEELIGVGEYSFVKRGFATKIGTDFDRLLNCEFCGQCVDSCPVGALNDRLFLHRARVWDLKETNTTCAYCGVGCTLTVGTKNNRILRVRAPQAFGINQGNLCVKGRFGWEYIHNPERLTTPLVKKDGTLVKASWEEAIGLVAQRFRELKAERGGEELAGLSSPRLTNEELYLFQKFIRGVLGTNHIDHAGGYSYAAHLALQDSLGYAATTNSINEIRNADVILALRSDLAETHPVIKSEVVLAVKRRESKLIVANSRNIGLKKFSALDLLVKPGTEVALVNGMAQTILREGLVQEAFVQSRTEGIEALKRSLERYSPDQVEALTGVPAASLTQAARLFALSPRAVILISTGQASGRQDAPLARAAANLALLTGQIGKEGSGIFLLGEKNNSQGALDMGVTPGLLPGFGDVRNAAERGRFEKAWNMAIPEKTGRGALAILQAIEEGAIKGLYLAGENLAVTYPDSARTQKALAALDFLVVQDCFLTETAALAHVLLPTATFAEKEGTFTNVERRVQRARPALEPIGQARPDRWIFQELAKEMGVPLGGNSAKAVMDEIRSLVPLYQGMDYARLDSPEYSSGLQWPCPSPDHPGTPVLYEKDFPGGKAKFTPAEHEEDAAQAGFPWFLITGPTMFHSGSLSRRSPGLSRLQAESCVLVHPADARKLGLMDQQKVSLESKQGKITAQALVSERAAPGTFFLPCHSGQDRAHQLTGWDLRITQVKIEKI